MKIAGGRIVRIGVIVMLCLWQMVMAGSARGNPTNGVVASGDATIGSSDGTTLTIRQNTPNVVINWESFNIAPNEVTHFIQPTALSLALNRIGGSAPSEIFGTLRANGVVMLLNRNGVIFQPGSQVDVGGLVASSLHMTDRDFLAGNYRLLGAVTDGLVRNLGNIRAGSGGVYLIAPNVENAGGGIITANDGSISLSAGTTAYLSSRSDGRGFLVELQAPAGAALNLGALTADGGHISMSGLSVNQQGVVQANAIQSRGGKIELVAKQNPASPGPTPARALLGASSRTQADGGSIEVVGQEVAHDGLLQANMVGNRRGRIDVRAMEGSQPGAGVATTGATSRIQADGGDILVQGRTVTHQGTAQADSTGNHTGHILFWGKNALSFVGTSYTRARGSQTGVSNGGTIIGMATDLSIGQLNVSAGSIFDVSGGVQGGHGGELLLGDRRGDAAGFGAVPFLGGTAGGSYLPGRFRLIPHDLALDIGSTNLGPLHDVTLVALNNVTVTGSHRLENLAPGAPAGRLRFLAGNDLSFDNTTIRVDPFGYDSPSPPKDIVGVAGNDIRFTNSTLSTGHGGSIEMTARSGSIRLIDPTMRTLSSVRVKGGGDLVLTAQKDIVASMRVAQELTQNVLNGEDDSNVQGLLVDGTRFTDASGARTGTGTLSITTKEGNFVGATVLADFRGPGFMVRNADAVVSVGGRIGDTNLPLDAGGLLPDGLTVAALNRDRAGQQLPPLEENASGYLDLAMTDAKVSIHAGGNLYLRRVSDAGVAWDLASPFAGTADWGRFRTPGTQLEGLPSGQPFFFGALLNEGFQHNDVTLVSRHGNLVLDTQRTPFFESGGPNDMQVFGQFLPARFDAQATEGTVQIRSPLGFFNGPQARLNFSAGGNIDGLLTYALGPPPAEFIRWVYVPNLVEAGLSLRNYVAIDTRKPVDPKLQPFLLTERPRGLPDPETILQPPEHLWELQPGFVPSMRLSSQTPSSLGGRLIGVPEEAGGVTASTLGGLGSPDKASPPGTIRLTAGSNIHNLNMDFRDPTYLKDIRLQAGNDIRNVDLLATASNMGRDTRTVVESIPMLIDPTTGRVLRAPILNGGPQDDVILIRDPNDGGRIRPWNGTESVDPANVVNIRMVSVTKDVPVAKPAVTIEAGRDIKLGLVPESIPSAPGPSFGLRFFGNGTVSIKAGRDLDLGNGTGILMSPGLTPDRDPSLAGLLDIGVGRNLTMAQSRIVTDGGAGVSIHGNDPAYIPGYDNSALHPVGVPESVRGRRNLLPIGGFIDVGETVSRRIGEESTGIQVRLGGSVGVRANRATVGFTDPPIVNFPLVRDPAAVHIQSTGDVNVRTSRIGTFSGGDIRIISTAGSINAGSGGKGERQLFQLDVPKLDANGRPILKSDGTIETEPANFEVPGSGIFTYHPTDPQVLDFPKFDTPEITALKNEIFKQRVFNRNTASLEARAEAQIAKRTPEFDAIFEGFIIKNPGKLDPITGERLPLSLGDVSLNAGADIVVPPAGIRGRRVDLVAGRTLDFQGGEVQGKVTFKAANLSGDVQVTGTFSGATSGGASVSIASSGGGGSVGGLSGVTGTVGASAGASVASVSTAQKASEAAQEAVTEASNQQAGQKNQQAAKTGPKEKDGKSMVAQALRGKRGVVIQVDVKPQTPSAN
jgi:filamentous hemagglutinin family protein